MGPQKADLGPYFIFQRRRCASNQRYPGLTPPEAPSVDLFNLLVTLGNNGSVSWLMSRYQPIYGNRHDMMPMLRSA